MVLAAELKDYERTELVGQLTVQGYLPCLTCGKGDGCEMSAVKLMYGPESKTTDIGYSRAEDQVNLWKEAIHMGQRLSERIKTAAR